MSFQLLDIILAAIMLISGLLALVRGFTREALSFVAWILAALATYFAIQQPKAIEFAQQFDLLSKPLLAQIAVGAVTFILVLIIVSVISVKISDAVIDSAAGGFDRTLGFIFGLGRGLVLVAISYLFYGWLEPPENHDGWIKNAQSLPLIKGTGELIVSLIPPDVAETLQNTALSAGGEADEAAPQNPPANDQQGGVPDSDAQNLGNLSEGASEQPAGQSGGNGQ
jgi:membrane protein required for colicin V production